MSLVAAIIVIAFGLVLVGFAGVAIAKPAVAEGWLMHFASSARAHYTEQVVRVLVGAALVVLSPFMWRSKIFLLLGWVIVVSSAVLLCIPWQWHHRFAQRVLPIVVRHLKLYALGSLAFGMLFLYGVFAGPGGA